MVWRIIEVSIWSVLFIGTFVEALCVIGYHRDTDDLLDDNTRLHERLDRLQWEMDKLVNNMPTSEFAVFIPNMDRPTPDQYRAPTRPDFRALPPPPTVSVLAIDADTYGRHAMEE